MKRGITIGDTHCGHLVGLTPPEWVVPEENDRLGKFGTYQREIWKWYCDRLATLPPLDFIFFNGDAIEGGGSRSGGTELITSDANNQVDMAIACLRVPKRKLTKKGKMLFTYGTAYHVGTEADYERNVADEFGAKIGSHEWASVEGVTFDLKHHIGSSSVPHARSTAVERDKLWSDIWSDLGRTPKANIIIRSHVHYHRFSGDHRYLVMTLPAMQGYGTKFGGRRCSGVVDIGFVYWEIEGDKYTWKSFVCEPASLKVAPVKI